MGIEKGREEAWGYFFLSWWTGAGACVQGGRGCWEEAHANTSSTQTRVVAEGLWGRLDRN